MQRVSLQGLAIILISNFAQRPRPPEIYRHRDKHYEKCGQGGFNLHVMEKQTLNRLVDNRDTGEEQQPGFDKCRKVFDFSMAVLVVSIGRLVGDTDGE